MQTIKRTIPASEIPYWYVLIHPGDYRKPDKVLATELLRRERDGEPLFDYFAPSYEEVRRVGGKFVNTRRPLLLNYVFVHASENQLFQMKRTLLRRFNFLPRVRELDGSTHFPYVTESSMQNLRWVARGYDNVIPAYLPDPHQLLKGDRVRIIDGRFSGVEATVVNQPGHGSREVVVCLDNFLLVPLLHVRSGQYEVVGLNETGKHLYTHLDNDCIHTGLHQALGRFYASAGITDADSELARKALRLYQHVDLDTYVMRCKQYAILLMAHTLLGNDEERSGLLSTIQGLLPVLKAEQSKALLATTLYGCTDNHLYYDLSHRLVDAWRTEEAPKKFKRQLIDRLSDYDKWLNHV